MCASGRAGTAQPEEAVQREGNTAATYASGEGGGGVTVNRREWNAGNAHGSEVMETSAVRSYASSANPPKTQLTEEAPTLK